MATKKTDKQIKDEVAKYMALPYAREFLPNGDGTWFGKIVEFSGCMTEGDTIEEASKMLDDAMSGWLYVAIEDGDTIPRPLNVERYSGRFMTRVPKSLHRAIAEKSEHEGVSLNQYVVTTLARAVGQ